MHNHFVRPGPAYDFYGTYGNLGGFFKIYGDFMEFSEMLLNSRDFYGEMIL